ncbi:MAG: hypothetical protein FWD06_03425 [Oscillospiraceae bacterium]|nr:hypothetical protein [Oscillospiraceae bacterium]
MLDTIANALAAIAMVIVSIGFFWAGYTFGGVLNLLAAIGAVWLFYFR